MAPKFTGVNIHATPEAQIAQMSQALVDGFGVINDKLETLTEGQEEVLEATRACVPLDQFKEHLKTHAEERASKRQIRNILLTVAATGTCSAAAVIFWRVITSGVLTP